MLGRILANSQQLHDIAEVARVFDIIWRDLRDALHRYVLELHAGIERQRSKDGRLARSIEAIDIG